MVDRAECSQRGKGASKRDTPLLVLVVVEGSKRPVIAVPSGSGGASKRCALVLLILPFPAGRSNLS